MANWLQNLFGIESKSDRQQKALALASSIFEAQQNPTFPQDVKDAFSRNMPRAVEAMMNAGLDPEKFGDAMASNWKAQELQKYFADPNLTSEQRIGGLTGHDISPYQVSGQTGYNRYTGAMSPTPLGQADIAWKNEQTRTEQAQQRATDALTHLRGAQAQTEGTEQQKNQAQTGLYGAQQSDLAIRGKVIQEAANNPNIDPVLKLDAVGNKKPVFKSERIKVRKPDGSTVYMDRTPNLQGGFDYAPAQDAAGAPLMVPPSEFAPDHGTANQREAQDLAQTFEIPYDQALGLVMVDGPTRTREISKLQKARAQAGKSRPAAPEPPAYQQARNAIAKGANAEQVRARLKQMGLDPSRL